MANRVGQQLGSYRLLRLLGTGGFAEVYLGEHIHLKSQAAIKVLHASLAKEQQQDFLAEAQTVARLKHPHIVGVLEFGIEGSTPYLVMDFAPYGTLRTRYPRGARLPLPILLSSVRQVADALAYAHEHQVVHRDIKPENMLIDAQGQLVLSDSWVRYYGVLVIAVSPRFTTQECSGCGFRVKKTLSIRIHLCPACGLVLDRDWNAALNILLAALADLAAKNRTAGQAGTGNLRVANASGQKTASERKRLRPVKSAG